MLKKVQEGKKMKKGGHTMKTEKSRHNRLAGALTALMVMSLMCAGFVYAWNVHEASQRNNLVSHTTHISIDEIFAEDPMIIAGETVQKEVRFKNEGSSPVFLRVAYVETFEIVLGAGEWLADDAQGTNATKNWTDAWTGDWVHIDSWYYYKKVLPAGGATDLIMESVSFSTNLDPKYADANYEIDFIAEAVQLSDEAEVNANATQIVFGKTATVTNAVTNNGAVISGIVVWG